jgi:hypothetical protein
MIERGIARSPANDFEVLINTLLSLPDPNDTGDQECQVAPAKGVAGQILDDFHRDHLRLTTDMISFKGSSAGRIPNAKPSGYFFAAT